MLSYVKVSLPSYGLNLVPIFMFPCICFDGADPRNNLIDQRNAVIRNRGCTQAPSCSSIGKSSKIWLLRKIVLRD